MFDGSIEDKKFVNMSSKSFSSDSNVNVEVAVPFAFRVWDAFPAFFSSSSKISWMRGSECATIFMRYSLPSWSKRTSSVTISEFMEAGSVAAFALNGDTTSVRNIETMKESRNRRSI